MWGTSLGVGLGSGQCLAPHQVVNGSECVVGMQQCRAELGHPITGLAVAIETDANASAKRRREGKSQPVLGPWGPPRSPHLLTHPIPSPTPSHWSSPSWERKVSSLAPTSCQGNGKVSLPRPRDVIVMLMVGGEVEGNRPPDLTRTSPE